MKINGVDYGSRYTITMNEREGAVPQAPIRTAESSLPEGEKHE